MYESSQHLFFEYSFFGKVWSNVLIWSDVSCALSNNNFLHAIHIYHLVCHGKAMDEILYSIWMSFIWSIESTLPI